MSRQRSKSYASVLAAIARACDGRHDRYWVSDLARARRLILEQCKAAGVEVREHGARLAIGLGATPK